MTTTPTNTPIPSEQEIGNPVTTPPEEVTNNGPKPAGGETPTTFGKDAVEHQKFNGDQNTTGSGNYLKEEGLADYKKENKPKVEPHITPESKPDNG